LENCGYDRKWLEIVEKWWKLMENGKNDENCWKMMTIDGKW